MVFTVEISKALRKQALEDKAMRAKIAAKMEARELADRIDDTLATVSIDEPKYRYLISPDVSNQVTDYLIKWYTQAGWTVELKPETSDSAQPGTMRLEFNYSAD
tara:strand:+ start:221 stop:532 length:312 start_codon:yes stop_codon:yes gene_type:complete